MKDSKIDSEGLSEQEAKQRLLADGPNELPRSKPKNALHLLKDIATEPIFLLLVAIGTIYLLLGDKHEALMLLGFVFIVMATSFFQQRRTEHSLEALRDISSPRALVKRNGLLRRIPGREVTLGDIVYLAEGDRVPADLYLLDASNFRVDESMLTGESVPVAKQAPLTDHFDEKKTEVFSGTLVTQGTGYGYVFATGTQSALGKIGQSLSSIDLESTPIQKESKQVVQTMAIIGLLMAAALALGYGFLRGEWLAGLLAGLTLAMAILPEEIPVVLTLFMGLSAWRLAKENILARNIPAVELLGATTLLCVDKTGTLTANRMAVRQLWTPDHSYDTLQSPATPLPETLHTLLEFAVLASQVKAFDPMELAITESGQKLLDGTEHLHTDWVLVRDYPLSKELLAMSRVWQAPASKSRMIAAKGAPEAVIDLCHLESEETSRITDEVTRMASQGLRVIGVAQVRFEETELPQIQHDFDFEFLGLIALEDPLRKEVPQAITECRDAGIRVVMITGDHPDTALSIARQAGIASCGGVVSGAQLTRTSDEQLKHLLPSVSIFCRVQPEQKLRLVQAFQAQGEIVAMTGDGVNDAPALKAAHIGVAMGGRGTDVAREAAALVLLNDDFSSLLTAVKHGRRVFANLRKAIAFIIAVHIPIVGLSVIPLVLGWPILLMPVHILFLQLIIDPACSVVFEAEPLEKATMQAKPRSQFERLFDTKVLIHGFIQGFGLLVLLTLFYMLARTISFSEDIARSMMFAGLILSSLALIHTNRAGRRTLWDPETEGNRYSYWITLITLAFLGLVISVPLIADIFTFRPLNLMQTLLCLGLGLCSVIWLEALKWHRWHRKAAGNEQAAR